MRGKEHPRKKETNQEVINLQKELDNDKERFFNVKKFEQTKAIFKKIDKIKRENYNGRFNKK